MIKKVREKIKKISSSRRKASSKANTSISRGRSRQAEKTLPAQDQQRVTLGVQETAVGQTKFYGGLTPRPFRGMPQELPDRYGIDKIVLQVRDPWWLHTYWEVKPETMDAFRQKLGDDFYKARFVLRVYDVSQIQFNGTNAHRFFDIHIDASATNWYIDTGGPGRSWCVDYGLLLANGRFITIIRSNVVTTPLEGPSWITDEEWMIPDDMFARLYGMGFGFGKSSPGKAWREQMRQALFSGILASPGITSMSSPAKKRLPRERKFWLVVHTELIVYGATEPDAKVSVQGKPIALRPDGTFTLRFALPDGKQVIPVNAISADNEEERTITPVVTKETK
ncbi:MAG: DUF4912 domain-containing protein [Candidatus Omnitrophica bacterium]|nr:DUF4912 domain-containing protein [Candidatus Omnitrophota bacterium]